MKYQFYAETFRVSAARTASKVSVCSAFFIIAFSFLFVFPYYFYPRVTKFALIFLYEKTIIFLYRKSAGVIWINIHKIMYIYICYTDDK